MSTHGHSAMLACPPAPAHTQRLTKQKETVLEPRRERRGDCYSDANRRVLETQQRHSDRLRTSPLSGYGPERPSPDGVDASSCKLSTEHCTDTELLIS